MGSFPSGQRGQTVNLLAMPSKVRILDSPFWDCFKSFDKKSLKQSLFCFILLTMDKQFWKSGLNFSCTRCSACCRFDPGFVFLSEHDLSRLLEWAIMPKDEFIKVYCRWVPKDDGFEYLSLKEKLNYDCILWDDGCRAYTARPRQCSDFPFWNSILSSKDMWDINAQYCPGMGKGEFYSAEKIEKILTRRNAEPCIKRRVD